MTKKVVVHVTTIEEWKSVLDVWFKRGYEWLDSLQDYREDRFDNGSHQLALNIWGNDEITCFLKNNCNEDNLIEYADFMAQQEKTMAKETYYTTQEQLDLIEDIKTAGPFVSYEIAHRAEQFKELVKYFDESKDKALLLYLGGDTSVEFKVKEQLYRLWRDEMDGDIVYMTLNNFGTPSWTMGKDNAFTASREEIERWKTPAWSVEKAD